MIRQKNFGFTLIELLVVISIIGLLSSIILASLNSARAKARDAQRISIAQEIAKALELRYNDANNYPSIIGVFTNPGYTTYFLPAIDPYIKLNIASSDLSRFVYVRKDYSSFGATFDTCISTGGGTTEARADKFVVLINLEVPQTSSSNYVSSSAGSLYDRCLLTVYGTMNYKVGN